MGIWIRTTYEVVTPESAEYGDVDERGWVDAQGSEYSFRDLVALVACCEPSATVPASSLWVTDYEYRVDYITGACEQRSYHPVGPRDVRYLIKACICAGLFTDPISGS